MPSCAQYGVEVALVEVAKLVRTLQGQDRVEQVVQVRARVPPSAMVAAPPRGPAVVTLKRLPVRRLVPTDVVATTEPCALVERSELWSEVTAKAEEVAFVRVTLPLKVLVLLKVLVVVVEKAVAKTPVEELYVRG
jgi:hypothetical protein